MFSLRSYDWHGKRDLDSAWFFVPIYCCSQNWTLSPAGIYIMPNTVGWGGGALGKNENEDLGEGGLKGGKVKQEEIASKTG